MYKAGHLELLTAASHSRTCVRFFRGVPARGCESGVYSMFMCFAHAHLCMHGPYRNPLSNTTHPCLLSSSGSGPVELEHRAQLLPASEDFILWAKKQKQHGFNIQELCHFPSVWRTQYFCDCTKTMTKQDAGGSFNTKLFFQSQCHRLCYFFNLYLTRTVSWDWHILFFF